MTYPSNCKEKQREYRKRHYVKKLAEDPDFFKRKKAAWIKKHPDYFANYRANHRKYFNDKTKEWYAKNKAHRSEIVKNWFRNHPKVNDAKLAYMRLIYHGEVVIAEFCETCPEDDVRKATGNHHPDYDYPHIVVSCCDSCHYYLNHDENQNKSANKKGLWVYAVSRKNKSSSRVNYFFINCGAFAVSK